MKAWEYELTLRKNAIPKILDEEEQTWDSYKKTLIDEDGKIRLLWDSHVPGSYAPEKVLIGAIQSVENMGYKVQEAEILFEKGLEALKNNNMYLLHQITAEIFYELNNAEKDEDNPYWKFKVYENFLEYEKEIDFPKYPKVNIDNKFYNKLKAAWVYQICAGALGTAIEGYTSEQLKNKFGEINEYVRKPNTFNDDITYEIAFLKAFEKKGYSIKSKDIAKEWVGLIPSGWSAEDIALKNIRMGIFPPYSGYLNNPYREWIGAQMRGVVCGFVAPGDPYMAAKLAYYDGEVSHHNNGIMGEIFNAVMTSLAFVENDIKEILKLAVNTIPSDSEYYSVVNHALELCMEKESWQECWSICEEKYKTYNWIHAYPNAAAEVIALWFGNLDFDKTMNIISMEGQDVDCNAAQIASIIGIINGLEGIDYEKWVSPIGDEICTYVRDNEEFSLEEFCRWNFDIIKKYEK
ncbi:ADP-ribosylglycohydrolase family protein [Hathewaya histolytica]|uniref:ADP-ribosylglycohydrolase n=1 Tax=Hathewaya histolytica TaxID=1498 RepID=A0A4U9RCH1_HATHI|nr:ADP-ribosylglycohydrolase family protein [Hathewaya histolytica]VTQ89412.1 ADP-ribosylglycohydrolase [Hathewaya histolytica]